MKKILFLSLSLFLLVPTLAQANGPKPVAGHRQGHVHHGHFVGSSYGYGFRSFYPVSYAPPVQFIVPTVAVEQASVVAAPVIQAPVQLQAAPVCYSVPTYTVSYGSYCGGSFGYGYGYGNGYHRGFRGSHR